jgi:hypothetical protein
MEKEPMRLAGLLRTYFFGFVVTPLLAFGVPALAFWSIVRLLVLLDVNMHEYGIYVALGLGIASVLWAAVVIANILDRAAGRTPQSIARRAE